MQKYLKLAFIATLIIALGGGLAQIGSAKQKKKNKAKKQAPTVCVLSASQWQDLSQSAKKAFKNLKPVQLSCDESTTSVKDAVKQLRAKHRGDATVKLAQELIAAQFNIQKGANADKIKGAVEEARDLLCTTSIGSKPNGKIKSTAKKLANELADFNRGKRGTPSCGSGSGASGSGKSGSGHSGSGKSGSGHSGSGKKGKR